MAEQPQFANPVTDDRGYFSRYWQMWLGRLTSKTVTAHTMTIPKLTPGGSNGSITWDEQGRVTKYTDAT